MKPARLARRRRKIGRWKKMNWRYGTWSSTKHDSVPMSGLKLDFLSVVFWRGNLLKKDSYALQRTEHRVRIRILTCNMPVVTEKRNGTPQPIAE